MKTKLSIALTAAIAALAITTSAPDARAQCAQYCRFWIAAPCTIPPACFPITVTTQWSSGSTTVQHTTIVVSCGAQEYPQPIPCPTTFWNIDWVSLDGGLTRATPGPIGSPGAPVRYMLRCRTAVCVTATIGLTGCVGISILPC